MTGSQQGVSTMDRFNPAGCQGGNSSRGILSSHSHMSPESVRLMHRHRSVLAAATPTTTHRPQQRRKKRRKLHQVLNPPPTPSPSSPLNLQGSIRHSSSSLSSHTSSEAGNLHIMTDGLMGEHPEDPLHMQVGVCECRTRAGREKGLPPACTPQVDALKCALSLQPSPSSSSLSSIRSNSSQIINSAPSSARGQSARRPAFSRSDPCADSVLSRRNVHV